MRRAADIEDPIDAPEAVVATLEPHYTRQETSIGSRFERHSPRLFVLPAVILIVAFGLFPLLYSLGVSFLRWDLQRPEQEFVFLQNYADVFVDGRMWNALRNTLVIVLLGVAFELVFGMALAQTLIGYLPGKRFIIPLLILPAVITPLVAGHMWNMLYDAQYGPIDHILSILFQRPMPIVWLINPQTVYPAILTVEIWQWTPFMFLIFLAGLAAVNPELHEAAAIDGASAWQIFTRITLPILVPLIIVAVLFRALDLFKLFDIIFALTNGGPGTMTETASMYVYILGFKNFRIGYSAAASYFLLFLVAIVISILLQRIGDQTREE
jgi:multiple sugar transport system permease protein